MEQQRPNVVFNRVGIAMCILLGVVFYAQVLLTVLSVFLKVDMTEDTSFLLVLSDISYYVCAFPVYVFFISTIKSEINIEKKRLSAGKFAALFFISFAAMNLSNYITVLFHTVVKAITGIELGSSLDGVLDQVNVFMVVTTVILAPIIEEFTFRYFALNKLRRFGDKTAIIVTAVAFGLFHMNFEQAIYATAIGLVFGYVACKTGHIWYTIILHGMLNFFGGVLPIAVEGMDSPLGSLIYTIGYFIFILIGVFLFIKRISKVKLEPGIDPVRKPIATAILNPGTLIFVIVSLCSMLLTLIMQFVEKVM